MAKVARHVRISGHVQGVFFRVWAQQQAQNLQVTGWVRNCSDGSVEAHLEGEERAVVQMSQRIREGPPRAQVHDLQIRDAEYEGFRKFNVKH